MEGDNIYYQQQRREMLEFIPTHAKRLIDIGCGEGRFGEIVKATLPECEVWGIEPTDAAAAEAKKRCDRLIHSPLDDVDEIPSSFFDVVTMNDVLEHLPYSEPALRIARRILKQDGHLILSLPNVGYYLNLRDLIFKNSWEYKEYGVLDRTHLRFFTQRSAANLLEANGFRVLRAEGINRGKVKLHYAALFALFPRLTKPMQFPQFALVAQPK